MTARPVARERGVLSARAIAVRVLERVERDDAFAASALDAELKSASRLDPAERALATELVYGVLRTRDALSSELGRFVEKPLRTANPTVRAALLIGAYQLLLLDRVPAFAAVSESVTIIRTKLGPKPAAFVNAVLRKISREGARLDRGEMVRRSIPAWLMTRLLASVGGDDAALGALIGAGAPPDLSLVVYRSEDRESWLARFREAMSDGDFRAGDHSPHAIHAAFRGDLRTLPGAGVGAWGVQEEGSQVIALAAAPEKGARVLDACAGRGNKSLLLGARDPSLRVDAVDLYPAKLSELQRAAERMEWAHLRTHAVDWSVGDGGLEPVYDVVLVDAPCSGTGTIRRRPDLAARKTEVSIDELCGLQRTILARAAALAHPGGRVLYSVCSVLPEEGEEVARAAEAWGLRPEPFAFEGTRKLAGQAPSLRLLPHLHETDGYFLAHFSKI